MGSGRARAGLHRRAPREHGAGALYAAAGGQAARILDRDPCRDRTRRESQRSRARPRRRSLARRRAIGRRCGDGAGGQRHGWRAGLCTRQQFHADRRFEIATVVVFGVVAALAGAGDHPPRRRHQRACRARSAFARDEGAAAPAAVRRRGARLQGLSRQLRHGRRGAAAGPRTAAGSHHQCRAGLSHRGSGEQRGLWFVAVARRLRRQRAGV